MEISLWGVELRTRFGKTKSIIKRKENPQRKISRYGSDEHSYGMVVIRFYKKVNIHTKSAHPAERIEPPRTRPAPEPSPEQPAALGFELLDLLAQLVLAARMSSSISSVVAGLAREDDVQDGQPDDEPHQPLDECGDDQEPMLREDREALPARYLSPTRLGEKSISINVFVFTTSRPVTWQVLLPRQANLCQPPSRAILPRHKVLRAQGVSFPEDTGIVYSRALLP